MAAGKYQQWLEPDGLLRLEAWARDGLTDEQVANNMGIAVQTLRVWKKDHSSISSALKRGKEVVDIEVENALVKRAKGYEYEETKTVIEQDADGNKKIRTEKVKKHVSPDVTAQIFWLKNRKPDQWRDVRKLDLAGQVNHTNEIDEEDKKLLEDPEGRELIKQMYRRKLALAGTRET